MSIVTGNEQNGVLTLAFHGRVDSGNAAVCEAEINEIKAQHPGCTLVLDAEDLSYLSSAGLRILLRLRKEDPNLRMVNVSSDVYDVLEMTGFTEMIKVEKAYRTVSVEGCEVIGRGANGEVYRLDSETIIKLYLYPDALDDMKRERELARRAFVLGIPTAIPYDVVKVGSSYGSVFELINAKSFAKILIAEPEREEEVAKMYVDLLKKIHETEVNPDDMPDMRAVALGWVDFLKDYLPEDKWKKLHALVEAVPASNRMMHGDYHVKNVMLSNGEPLLIDMDTLAHGNPVFEFGSVFNAYVGFLVELPEGAPTFLGISREVSAKLWKDTLRLYFGTEDPARLQSLEDCAALIGYTRLYRRALKGRLAKDVDAQRITATYRERLIEVIDRLDSIAF